MEKKGREKDFTVDSWKALAAVILSLAAFVVFLWVVVSVVALIASVRL